MVKSPLNIGAVSAIPLIDIALKGPQAFAGSCPLCRFDSGRFHKIEKEEPMNKVPICIRFEPELIERINRAVAKLIIESGQIHSRSQFIREAIAEKLDRDA